MLSTSSPIPFHHEKDDGFNVDVVSAEGLSFRVDRQKLSCASTVLRHQLTASPVLSINEPASVLAPFLDVLMGDADVFPVSNNRASVLGAIDVLRLFVKYDCTTQLTLAATALKCMVMEHDVCPLEVFILGAAIGDVTLCRTAIVFCDKDDITALDNEAHADAIQAHWKAVPATYKIALLKAWEVKDPRDRGNRFTEAMYLEEHKSEIDHVEHALVPPPAPVQVPTINLKAPQPPLQRIRRPQVQRYEIDDDPFLSDDDE